MGECIISGGGRTVYISGSGGESTVAKLPVLNDNYPVDSYVKYNSNITLSCLVDMYYTDCTYQWYIDDTPIEGAINSTYVFTSTNNSYMEHSAYCRVTNSIGSTYSRTCFVKEYPTKFCILLEGIAAIPFDSNISHYPSTNYIGYSRVNGTTSTLDLVPLGLYTTLNVFAYSGNANYDLDLDIYYNDYAILKGVIGDETTTVDISNININAYIKLQSLTNRCHIDSLWLT